MGSKAGTETSVGIHSTFCLGCKSRAGGKPLGNRKGLENETFQKARDGVVKPV